MKKIIIIGASSGIGLQMANDFAAAGWQVGVAARRQGPLEALRELWPGRVVTSYIDVTALDAVSRFNELIEKMNGMDVLLFCSGTGFADPELDDAKTTNTLRVNTLGFSRIVSAAYRYFRANDNPRRGQIAAITSVAGTKGIGIAAAYSASKRFQQNFLDALRQLANQQGVAVDITDIRPGFIRTELLDADRNYPMIMPVSYASRLIEQAIIHRRRVAYIDLRWLIVNRLWAAIPRCIWRHIKIDFN